MLARVTYGLVGLALVTLVIGFFNDGSNVFLYTSIGLSVLAIILVLVSAARRAREAPADLDAEGFADHETLPAEDEEDLPEDVLAAFDEEEEEDGDVFEDEEVGYDDEDLDADEEPAPKATKTASKKKAAPKKKAAATSKAKSPAKASKVMVVPGRDRYHAADCRFVRDKDDDELEDITIATAKRRGYEPCSVCSPE